ncbi:hypothetical protein [Dactylosporangium sp. NPDC049140]|jgi:hypothetical protein|uniref:hypothetical protein n=1 Tax=Dactylosporangium sp. NPDC049140 TaxID=3155647 RepID=UPI0033F8F8ED
MAATPDRAGDLASTIKLLLEQQGNLSTWDDATDNTVDVDVAGELCTVTVAKKA